MDRKHNQLSVNEAFHYQKEKKKAIIVRVESYEFDNRTKQFSISSFPHMEVICFIGLLLMSNMVH